MVEFPLNNRPIWSAVSETRKHFTEDEIAELLATRKYPEYYLRNFWRLYYKKPIIVPDKDKLLRELLRLDLLYNNDVGINIVESSDYVVIVLPKIASYNTPSFFIEELIGPIRSELYDQIPTPQLLKFFKQEVHLQDNIWQLFFDPSFSESVGVGPQYVRTTCEKIFGTPATFLTPQPNNYIGITVEIPNNYFNHVDSPQVPADISAANYIREILSRYSDDARVKPRFLTTAEIESMLRDSIPNSCSAIRETAEDVRRCLCKKVRNYLLPLKISPLNIEELKRRIRVTYLQSQIEHGTAVGMNAAEALAQPVMQLTLNSFHAAGAAKTSPLDGIKETLAVPKNKKNKLCNIFFRDTLNFHEVLEMRSELVNTTVKSLLLDHKIYRPKEIFSEDLRSTNNNANPEERNKRLIFPPWYDVYLYSIRPDASFEDILDLPLEEVPWFLRLNFDIDKLYANNMTLDDIMLAINTAQGDNPAIFCIPSPFPVTDVNGKIAAFIDIYPIADAIENDLEKLLLGKSTEESEKEKTEESEEGVSKKSRKKTIVTTVSLKDIPDLAVSYFSAQVIPKLDKIHLSGIPGIEKVSPEQANFLDMLSSDRKLYVDEQGNMRENTNIPEDELVADLDLFYVLRFSRYKMQEIGIPKILYYDFFDKLGIEITDYQLTDNYVYNNGDRRRYENYYWIVKMPILTPQFHADSDHKVKGPITYLRYLSDTDKNYEFLKLKDENRSLISPKEFMANNGIYYYASAEGSNLLLLYSNPRIDSTKTLSNNPIEIQDILGIEATRGFMIRDFYNQIVQNKGDINPRHLTLIVDFMTQSGVPTAITLAGSLQQAPETLAVSTFERAMEMIRNAAVFGKQDQVKSTSSSIILGQMPKIGTGTVEIRANHELLAQREPIYNQEVIAAGVNLKNGGTLDPNADEAVLQEAKQVTQVSTELNEDEGLSNTRVNDEETLQLKPKRLFPVQDAKNKIIIELHVENVPDELNEVIIPTITAIIPVTELQKISLDTIFGGYAKDLDLKKKLFTKQPRRAPQSTKEPVRTITIKRKPSLAAPTIPPTPLPTTITTNVKSALVGAPANKSEIYPKVATQPAEKAKQLRTVMEVEDIDLEL